MEGIFRVDDTPVHKAVRTCDISVQLNLSDARTRAILKEMTNDGIIIAEGKTNTRLYRIKKYESGNRSGSRFCRTIIPRQKKQSNKKVHIDKYVLLQ